MNGDARRDQILGTIAKLHSENGWDPSVTDIANAVSLSRTTTFYHLNLLREDGLVISGPRGGWRLQPDEPPKDPSQSE